MWIPGTAVSQAIVAFLDICACLYEEQSSQAQKSILETKTWSWTPDHILFNSKWALPLKQKANISFCFLIFEGKNHSSTVTVLEDYQTLLLF